MLRKAVYPLFLPFNMQVRACAADPARLAFEAADEAAEEYTQVLNAHGFEALAKAAEDRLEDLESQLFPRPHPAGDTLVNQLWREALGIEEEPHSIAINPTFLTVRGDSKRGADSNSHGRIDNGEKVLVADYLQDNTILFFNTAPLLTPMFPNVSVPCLRLHISISQSQVSIYTVSLA